MCHNARYPRGRRARGGVAVTVTSGSGGEAPARYSPPPMMPRTRSPSVELLEVLCTYLDGRYRAYFLCSFRPYILCTLND